MICPAGKKVTPDNQLFWQPARPDFPALIVVGDLVLHYSSDMALSEAANGVNYNPTGAPHDGVSDLDRTDSYPSEVRGLVHATGVVKMDESFVLRGALLSGSTATSDAIDVNDEQCTILHDPRPLASPPPWYTLDVPMVLRKGSLLRKVE